MTRNATSGFSTVFSTATCVSVIGGSGLYVFGQGIYSDSDRTGIYNLGNTHGFCRYCGVKAIGDERYCGGCGAPAK
mgnify:CR=1 FL=1